MPGNRHLFLLECRSSILFLHSWNLCFCILKTPNLRKSQISKSGFFNVFLPFNFTIFTKLPFFQKYQKALWHKGLSHFFKPVLLGVGLFDHKTKKAPFGAFLFYRSVGWENSAFRLRKWSAPSDQAENSLLIWGAGSVTSNLLRSLPVISTTYD